MTAAVQWINPGALGFTAGGVLIVCAVGLLWLALSGRRAHAEAVAETAPAARPAPTPQPWHPSQGPQRRVDDATQLIARCSDDPNATLVIPRQRAARRG